MSLGLPFWEWEFKGHYIHCFIVIYILGSLYPTTQDIILCFELYSVIVKPNEHVFLQFCNRLVIFKFWVNMKIFDTLLKAYFLRSHFNFFKKLLLFIYLFICTELRTNVYVMCLSRGQVTTHKNLFSPFIMLTQRIRLRLSGLAAKWLYRLSHLTDPGVLEKGPLVRPSCSASLDPK